MVNTLPFKRDNGNGWSFAVKTIALAMVGFSIARGYFN
jgi:hypothetical protein